MGRHLYNSWYITNCFFNYLMLMTNYNLCYSTNRCFLHSTISMFTFYNKEFTIILKEVKVMEQIKIEKFIAQRKKEYDTSRTCRKIKYNR